MTNDTAAAELREALEAYEASDSDGDLDRLRETLVDYLTAETATTR